LLGGCGPSDDPETPRACLGSPDDFVAALAAAPGAARFADGTLISECLVDNQSAGDQNTVGRAMVLAATQLNERAHRDPGGADTVRLGYLVGAANRGAADTSGIHTDLLRRLNSAARYSAGGMPLPAAFERAYGRGYAAGRRDG
jgi:hypothetical protein